MFNLKTGSITLGAVPVGLLSVANFLGLLFDEYEQKEDLINE